MARYLVQIKRKANNPMQTLLLIITTVLTALLAGVFVGYAISVNWALGKLTDREYVRAMQQINIVIQNPLFFLIFMGPVPLLPIVAYISHGAGNPLLFALVLAATIIYIVGSFVLTVVGNVPYNEKLARLRVDDASSGEVAQARHSYEKPWNAMHAVRTIASVVAAVLLVVACTVAP